MPLAYVRAGRRAARRAGVALVPHLAAVGRLARVGVDLLVRTAALRAAFLVATAVAARLGAVDVAAHQVAFEVWSFLALGLDAVAIAGQALVGRALGAGEGEAARSAGPPHDRVGRGDGRRLRAGADRRAGAAGRRVHRRPRGRVAGRVPAALRAASLQPVNAVAFVLDGVLIGAGDLAFLARAMVGSSLVFVPLAVLVATTGAGIGWLWAALGVFMATRAGALLARFASDRWVVAAAPPADRSACDECGAAVGGALGAEQGVGPGEGAGGVLVDQSRPGPAPTSGRRPSSSEPRSADVERHVGVGGRRDAVGAAGPASSRKRPPSAGRSSSTTSITRPPAAA